jgi:hypothetical protein
MKPGNTPLYINHNSNHPPPILRSIPDAINKRLSNISSDKQSFESAVPPYQEALRKSGFNYVLNYNPQPPKPKRNRNRNVIWFNPPYSANVATNIGHKFLQAIDECFPPNHPLHKLFNRNNLKLSTAVCPTCTISSQRTTEPYSIASSPRLLKIPIGSAIAARKNPAPSLANV